MWRVESPDNNVDNIIISYEEPILLMRVNLMKVPADKKETFYERLLKLNASEIPHGAFGIEEIFIDIIWLNWSIKKGSAVILQSLFLSDYHYNSANFAENNCNMLKS